MQATQVMKPREIYSIDLTSPRKNRILISKLIKR